MELGDVFYAESLEMLDEIISDLIKAESGDAPDDFVGHLFRTFHSIKGGAAMLGYTHIEKLAHNLEDTLAEMRDAGQVPQGDTLTLVIDITYLLQEMIVALQNRSQEDFTPRTQRLIQLLGKTADKLEPAVKKVIQPVKASDSAPFLPFKDIAGAVTENVPKNPLFLVHCRICDDALMPDVTKMVIQRNLSEIGDVLFASEDSPAAAWLDKEAVYLVASGKSGVELYDQIDLADVQGVHVTPVVDTSRDVVPGQLLSRENVVEFNQAILRLVSALVAKGIDNIKLLQAVATLRCWFQANGHKLDQGLWQQTYWEQGLSLLEANIRLSEAVQEPVIAKLIVTNNIQDFWNHLYTTLCCKFYYFEVPVNDIKVLQSLDKALEQIFARGEFIHGNLNISSLPPLQFEDNINIIKDIFTHWESQGKHLSIVVAGDNYPKYDILCLGAAGTFPGGRIYRSQFEAFLGVEGA